jgi:hypothetical protein
MSDANIRKIEQLKRCISAARRLGMEISGLLPFELSGIEQQLIQGTNAHLNHITVNLNEVLLKREQEREQPETEEVMEITEITLDNKPRRARGSIRL